MYPDEQKPSIVDKLQTQATHANRWSTYYEGKQPLSYMQPELLREIGPRVRQVVINWPRLVVDSLEERLDVEGFRLNDEVDQRAWDWWQANQLDVGSQQAHTEALVSGCAYVIVGASDDDPDTPLITVESPQQVYAERDARNRRVTRAVKVWRDENTQEIFKTLYLPDETVHYYPDGPPVIDRHDLGVVPVVPLVNRGRIIDPSGVSELTDIVPLSDAACKIATDMMVSADFHAIPRLVALGVSESDFQDQAGNVVSKWERIAGRIWAMEQPPGEADVKQLPEADLRNFHDTLNALARLAAAMSGLPPHYFGWSDANPASADAIRSAETRLVKRAERRQRSFGEAWEDVIRLGFLVTQGSLPDGATRLETVWRDPATPTVAQTADALVKLAVGLQIPPRALWGRVPNVSAAEVDRWNDIANDDRRAEARAQATAFGLTGLTDNGEPG